MPEPPPNACRWNGKRRPHYEAWHLTLNHERTGHAFWIRKTLTVPADSSQPPQLGNWFFRFCPRNPAFNLWMKEETPLTGESHPAELGPVTSQLRTGFAGNLEQRDHWAQWGVNFVPTLDRAFTPIPLCLRPFVATRIAIPVLDGRFDGRILCDGATYDLSADRGTQSHLWGKGLPQSAAWAHCSNFHDADAILEAVTLPLFGIRPTSLMVERRYKEFLRPTFWTLIKNRHIVRPSPIGWKFAGTTALHEVVAEVTSDPTQLIAVEDTGPRGESRFTYNTEVASLKLTLRKRRMPGALWEEEVLTAQNTCHYSFTMRERRMELPLHLD